MDNFDAETMVREIRAGAERGRLVASLRPSWAQLGEELWLLHDSAQAAFFPSERRQSIVTEAKNFIKYSNDSPCAEDVSIMEQSRTNAKNELVLRLARMYIGGLVNHLGGLSALLAAEVSARPAVALGRVILDASTHCAFLLESAPSPERTLRALNLQLAMLRAEMADITEGSGKDSDQEIEPLRLEVANLIENGVKDGFKQAVSKSGRPQNSFTPGTPAIEQLFKAFHSPDLFRNSWRHASSVVHVQERRIMEFYFGSGKLSQEVHGRSYVALQMMPSILAATRALDGACRYLGADPDDITNSSNRVLHWWALAAGMHDEELLRAHSAVHGPHRETRATR